MNPRRRADLVRVRAVDGHCPLDDTAPSERPKPIAARLKPPAKIGEHGRYGRLDRETGAARWGMARRMRSGDATGATRNVAGSNGRLPPRDVPLRVAQRAKFDDRAQRRAVVSA
jgi:hypothetical protein